MAAHVLSKNQKAACLTKAKAIEISKKPKLKNVLCGESHSWPKPTREVEDKVLLKLSEIFKSLPNIFKPVKSSTKSDQEEKRKIRAQLDLGINCVSRSLEKDRLSCVLLSGKVTPPSAVEHIITVARERGCPLICLNSMNTSLAKVLKSKAFPTCIGFKKLLSSTKSHFVDLISLVQKNSIIHKGFSSLKKNDNGKKTPRRNALPESLRPILLDANTDEAVRQDLKRIFTNASFKEAENKMKSSKDRKKKKTKKKLKQYYRKWLHNQFESGKKTVSEFVGRSKIQMVLIIPELIPVLMSEPAASSLLCIARDQDCPVLCVSNLSMVMCADTAKALAVLGIKKQSCLPMNTESSFNCVIKKCLDFMRTAPMPAQNMDINDSSQPDASKESTMEEDEDTAHKEDQEEDYSFLHVLKKDSAELKEKALKLKAEQDETSKQLMFTSDFISFGGVDNSTSVSRVALGKRKNEKSVKLGGRLKPKKMLLDKKKEQQQPQANVSGDAFGFISLSSSTEKQQVEEMATDESGETNKKENASGEIETDMGDKESTDSTTAPSPALFAISRAGDQIKKPLATKTGEEKESVLTSPSSTMADNNVLGLDESMKDCKDEEAEHAANIFSATARKGKNEDKKRHAQEGFVSFAYTEANIHTMVSNPNRQKKKKGKK